MSSAFGLWNTYVIIFQGEYNDMYTHWCREWMHFIHAIQTLIEIVLKTHENLSLYSAHSSAKMQKHSCWPVFFHLSWRGQCMLCMCDCIKLFTLFIMMCFWIEFFIWIWKSLSVWYIWSSSCIHVFKKSYLNLFW